MRKKAVSGTIQYTEEVLRFNGPFGGDWELPLSDVSVVGEYTTESLAGADDYFLVFVTRSGSFCSVPIYADGFEVVRISLEKFLGEELILSLCNSTSLASRIIFPRKAKGESLFEFRKITERGFVGSIRKALGLEKVEFSLSQETSALLGR